MPNNPDGEKVAAAVRQTYRAVIGPSKAIAGTASVARQAATAQAFQSVAQSAAFAVGSASSYLSNTTLIGLAAVAVAVAKMAENPEVNVVAYQPLLAKVTDLLQSSVTNLTNVGEAASNLIKDFPSS